jgi:hypothetical protein
MICYILPLIYIIGIFITPIFLKKIKGFDYLLCDTDSDSLVFLALLCMGWPILVLLYFMYLFGKLLKFIYDRAN